MEASKGLNTWSVMMSELSEGRELAKQLQNHLDPSTPPETCKYLIEKILFTYNNLLDHMSNLPCKNSFPVPLTDPSSQISFHVGTTSESPHSVSHNIDPETHRRASKRRKTLPRWVKTVKVGTEEGVEGTLYDGYNWRKYGQKVILGAAFPRGYYRCTHRYTRGCCATKQVQKKSAEDSTIFEVIYKGHHICSQPSHVSQPSTSRNLPPVPEPTKPDPQAQELQNLPLQQTPLGVQTHLKVETKSPDIVDQDNIFDYRLDELFFYSDFHFDDPEFFY